MKKLTMAVIAAIAAVFFTPAIAPAGKICGTGAAQQGNPHLPRIPTPPRPGTTARLSARLPMPYCALTGANERRKLDEEVDDGGDRGDCGGLLDTGDCPRGNDSRHGRGQAGEPARPRDRHAARPRDDGARVRPAAAKG